MRTKTLLLTAALVAVGTASSMAQVYSVNAVGYINVTVPAGKFKMVANQLNATNMTLAALIPTAPDGTTVYQYNPGSGYTTASFDALFGGAWGAGGTAITLNPGDGVFVFNPDSNPFTVTFVGEVPQGTLNNPVPPALSMQSSIVPQAGGITSVLGYPPDDGDQLYQFDPTKPGTGGYNITTYDGLFGSGWGTPEPSVAVGEAFFMDSKASASKTWSRTFTVN